MNVNTPEIRESFVSRFGYNHPGGIYNVDDATARKILGQISDSPNVFLQPDKLWSLIMQDRASYMLGERYLLEVRADKGKVSGSDYVEVGQKVTAEIILFVDEFST